MYAIVAYEFKFSCIIVINGFKYYEWRHIEYDIFDIYEKFKKWRYLENFKVIEISLIFNLNLDLIHIK